MKNLLLNEILSHIEWVEKDRELYDEINFNVRVQAIDYLEFHVIDRIDSFMEGTELFDRMTSLKQYAKKVICDLQEVNRSMFCKLRKKISHGGYREKLLTDLINDYLDYNFDKLLQQDITGYDDLDVFLDGLLTYTAMPVETKAREPEMIYYQKTPVRIIFEIIKRAECQPNDIFFDLGSGLGQAAILVNLITSVVSKGVEFEPSFCNYAKTCAVDLNLKDVAFINTDARYADYSSGTIFFMYTPFEGQMLKDVLENLYSEAKKRRIKIFTYGSCTIEVARENWLISKSECQKELGEFISAEL